MRETIYHLYSTVQLSRDNGRNILQNVASKKEINCVQTSSTVDGCIALIQQQKNKIKSDENGKGNLANKHEWVAILQPKNFNSISKKNDSKKGNQYKNKQI